MAMVYCTDCGKKISESAHACPTCGAPNRVNPAAGEKKWWIAFLLCWFLGMIGAHRYYLRQTASAVVMTILTCTIVGMLVTAIWNFVDWVILLVHAGDDAYVNKIAAAHSPVVDIPAPVVKKSAPKSKPAKKKAK
ncbi:MAG: TM2 domain-containing protein [Alphaproteobacteria bacterium]|nr:TM2 domain-containing protein [Alphaproteobacteria bacterium]